MSKPLNDKQKKLLSKAHAIGATVPLDMLKKLED